MSVSLSSDGGILAVGGPVDDNGKGATWIFVFDGSTYLQLGDKLVGSGSILSSQQGKFFAVKNKFLIDKFYRKLGTKRSFRLVGKSIVGWTYTCRWGSL